MGTTCCPAWFSCTRRLLVRGQTELTLKNQDDDCSGDEVDVEQLSAAHAGGGPHLEHGVGGEPPIVGNEGNGTYALEGALLGGPPPGEATLSS